MKKSSYAVVLDDDHISSTRNVAEELSKQGFIVGRILDAVGAIYGVADEPTITRVRGIDGVEDVRLTSSVQLPEFKEGIPQ